MLWYNALRCCRWEPPWPLVSNLHRAPIEPTGPGVEGDHPFPRVDRTDREEMLKGGEACTALGGEIEPFEAGVVLRGGRKGGISHGDGPSSALAQCGEDETIAEWSG